MLVREMMTADVVTVGADATLRDAVAALLDHGVGSVVVTVDGDPAGLVTETDALEAVYEGACAPGEVPVRDLIERPVVTTAPDRTVQRAARTMADEGVKKLLVLDDMDVVGIVTLTDVVWHLAEIRSEAMDIASAEWGP